MEESLESVNSQIRKFKKKLRQIEHLVCLPRPLNNEEQSKVSQKAAMQASLMHYMKLLQPHQQRSPAQSDSDELSSTVAMSKTKVTDSTPASGDIQQPPAKRAAVGCSRASQSEQPSPQQAPKSSSPLLESTAPVHSQSNQATIESRSVLIRSENYVVNTEKSDSQSDQVSSKAQIFSSHSDKPGQTIKKSASQSEQPKQLASQSEQTVKLRQFGSYSVSELPNGHSDIIFSVDCLQDLAISAGRDASAQLYNVSGSNLGCHGNSRLTGHTQAVNVARLVDCSDCPTFFEALDIEALNGSPAILCVTGSEDATVRIWDCSSGRQLFEHYVFASVTALQLLKIGGTLLILTGSSSGKLELWDPARLWDRGPCLMAEQILNGRVADLQVYNSAECGVGSSSSSLLIAGCSASGQLVLCLLDGAASGSPRLIEPPVCHLTALSSTSAGTSGSRLRLRQPTAVRLMLPSSKTRRGDSQDNETVRIVLADRDCTGLKCASMRLQGSDGQVAAVHRPANMAADATSICDCLLLIRPSAAVEAELILVAAFDYLAGSSYLQVFESASLASLGRTDAKSARGGVDGGVGRILSLAAVYNNASGSDRNAATFSVISGGDRVLFWSFFYSAAGGASGRLPVIANPASRHPVSALSTFSSSSDFDSSTADDNEDGYEEDEEDYSERAESPQPDAESAQQRRWCSVA